MPTVISPTVFNKRLLDLQDRRGFELVILGTSLLDTAMTLALEHTLHLAGKPLKDVLAGPARTLSNKITLARSLDAITGHTADECHKVRAVRNIFAHSIDVNSLDDDVVRAKVQSFDYDSIDFPERLESMLQPSTKNRQAIIDVRGVEVFALPSHVAENMSADDCFRHQVWSCVFATVGPVFEDWFHATSL